MWIIPRIGLRREQLAHLAILRAPVIVVAMLLAGIARRLRGAPALLAILCLFVVG